MSGNTAFESASASSSELGFSGTFLNGQRGMRSAAVGPKLDRSGNFREGSDSRMFGSGFALPRGGGSGVVASDDLRTLSLCMSLEPIEMGDHKIAWYGELRKAMGFSVGSTAEENSFGAAAAREKPSPPVAVVKDLKRIRLSVVDTCVKARDRANKMDECLHKLDKYYEAVTSKKQQSELAINDRAGALNLKMGTQVYGIIQGVQDRPKNILLNKRVRTSVAESRSNGIQRQPVAMAKDENLLEDNGGESDLFEKIRRLAAGGEGWDKKVKRKRSVGTFSSRPIDSDGVTKRPAQNKVVDGLGSQPNDAPICRLGASNGTGGSNKFDMTSLPNSSSMGLAPKIEHGVPILPEDLSAGSNKERVITKENSKLNNSGNCYTTCPSPVTKSKASRTTRTGPMVVASSSPGIPYLPGTHENWQNAKVEDKILSHDGDSNRKRPMPLGSASAPMAQWVGPRPQKMPRSRRANLVPPVSNQDEKQLSFERCSLSDGARLAFSGTNGSISRNATNGPQKVMVKFDNFQSPLRFSGSEDSVGGENRLKDKEIENGKVDAIGVQNVGPSVTLAKKNKPLISEERDIGLWRQGHSGRGPSIAKSIISPMGNRLDNLATPKSLQSSKTGCKKSGSKLGRPSKRLLDGNGFSHSVLSQHSGSADCTGGSDYDREELLAAANHARIASHLACPSAFWKIMEPMFASVRSEDKSFLSQQLKPSQENQESVPQLLGCANNAKAGLLNEDSVFDALPSRGKKVQMQNQGSESFSRSQDLDKTSNGFMPLYQRVLSALIIEDDFDELEKGETRNIQFQNAFRVSTCDTYRLGSSEPRKAARMENGCDTMFGTYGQGLLHSGKNYFPSNGGINSYRSHIINSLACEDGHSKVEPSAGISKSSLNKPQMLQTEGLGILPLGQYEQMCLDDKLLRELQSIGLCSDSLPNLDDKENETIVLEVDKLKRRLNQQEVKKKEYLEKIREGVESNSRRGLETRAMDSLVELASRKLLLATRRTSRSGIHKVPKDVALAFATRTLGRCHKYENSGTSCFNEPPFQDALYAPNEIEAEPVGWPAASTKYFGAQRSRTKSKLLSDGNMFGYMNHVSDEMFARNGPISNRGKKKEILLESVGGWKGKRSGKGGGRERKTKAKPKAKPRQKKGFVNKVAGSELADGRRDIRYRNKNVGVDDLEGMDEELGGHDLTSFLNFEEQDVEGEFAAGLDIPMDDLTQLF